MPRTTAYVRCGLPDRVARRAADVLPLQERPGVDQATTGIGGRLRVSVDAPCHFVMHVAETLSTGGPEHPDRRANIDVLSD